jgi:hypothetical protein
MGKLLIVTKYIFLIYSTDIYESRRHIHVTYKYRGFKKSCKFWLEPEIMIDESKTGDFTDSELREIELLIHENKLILMNQLNLFYKQVPVKAIRK